jgi:hypothetical protein
MIESKIIFIQLLFSLYRRRKKQKGILSNSVIAYLYNLFLFFLFFFIYIYKYLVDPASSHMLVSKIKPCMSKFKCVVQRDCRWLIKSVIV